MTETATTTDPTTETAEQLQAAEAKRLKIAEALNAANEERRQLFATPITSNPLGQQARAVLESGDPDRADGRDPNSRAHELARKIESLTQAQRAVEGECRAALGAHHQAQLEAVAPAVDVALAAVLEQVPALAEAVVALNETVADAVEQLGPDGPPLVNPLRSQLQLRSGSLLAGLLVPTAGGRCGQAPSSSSGCPSASARRSRPRPTTASTRRPRAWSGARVARSCHARNSRGCRPRNENGSSANSIRLAGARVIARAGMSEGEIIMPKKRPSKIKVPPKPRPSGRPGNHPLVGKSISPVDPKKKK
jgi:hypothetical protein